MFPNTPFCHTPTFREKVHPQHKPVWWFIAKRAIFHFDHQCIPKTPSTLNQCKGWSPRMAIPTHILTAWFDLFCGFKQSYLFQIQTPNTSIIPFQMFDVNVYGCFMLEGFVLGYLGFIFEKIFLKSRVVPYA
jgi:hypothetical protein